MKNRSFIPILIAALTSAVVGAPDAPDPFADARFAPYDVTAFIHLDDGVAVREQLGGRPISEWIDILLEDGDLHRAWRGLARKAGLHPDDLIDRCLGTGVTLMLRQGNAWNVGDPIAPEWALMTEIDPKLWSELRERLKPVILAPRGTVGRLELPEHELLLATAGTRVIVGPKANAQLFEEVVDRLGRPPARRVFRRPSLDVDPALLKVRNLGGGQVGVMVRHAAPMGGWSVAVARLRGDTVSVRHAARFENSPFQRRLVRRRCDCSPVAAFENDMLLAILEPLELGNGPIESYLATALDQPALSEVMGEHLGGRRIIAVGEVEGRRQEEPVDRLGTTVAFCLEVEHAEGALALLDDHLMRVVRQMNRFGDGAFEIHTGALMHDGPRRVDLSPAARWLSGDMPLFRNLSLNWTITDSPHGLWCVIASHRDHLDDVVEALKTDTELAPTLQVEQMGTADGQRIGRHLLSWSQADNLVGDAAEVAEFERTLRFMSAFASGVRRCRWTMARPSTRELRLDMQMVLTPGYSAPSGRRK